MRLYGYWRSSATWRVRIGLALKGVACEYVPVHLTRGGGEQRMAEHLARNPLGQVPVLEITSGGRTVLLRQSLAILEYLDEVEPGPLLLPVDPIARAQARMLAEVVNSHIQPLQNLGTGRRVALLGGDIAAWNREVTEQGLDALEILAAETAGRCMVGDDPSIADCCLVPQFYNARRYGLDAARWPTLRRVDAHCSSLRAFQDSHPDRQPDAVVA